MKNVVFAFIALCLFFSGYKKDSFTESVLQEIGAYGKWDFVVGNHYGAYLIVPDSSEFDYLIISYPARYELSRRLATGSYVSQKGRIEITEKVDSLAYSVNFDPTIGSIWVDYLKMDDGEMVLGNFSLVEYTFKKEY